MSLTERERRAHELGWLEAQQKAGEAIAGNLRAQAAAARAEQPPTLLGRMRAAFFAEVNEAWCVRLERMAAELERQAAGVAPEAKRRRDAIEAPRWRLPWKRKA